MNDIIMWATVFGTGILELWGALLVGFMWKLHPVPIALVSALGSITSAVVVIYFAHSLRGWLIKRYQRKTSKKQGKIAEVWQKYGVIGLAFLSPLITGAPLGAAIGIAFGAEPARLLRWMTVFIIFWSIVLTAAGVLGLLGFASIK
ncbi:small multi-drug export protein [Brevibacillus fluminis]|nr:small multi-drug export protein [Brevibacillus fluminis]